MPPHSCPSGQAPPTCRQPWGAGSVRKAKAQSATCTVHAVACVPTGATELLPTLL